jgi:hypothetical protein
MAVRPVVAEGDKVPVWVWEEGRGPRGKYPLVFWEKHEHAARRIDGRIVRTSCGEGTGAISGRSGTGSSEPAGTIGKHAIEQDVTLSLWYGEYGANTQEEKSQLLGTRKLTVKASYEVVTPDRAKIKLLDSEELRQQVLAAVKVDSISQQKNGYVNFRFQLSNAPCDLAFDVFLQTDKGETKMNYLCCARGKIGSYQSGSFTLPLPAQVKLIFRPSVDLAKNTVDETAIYSGEIVMPDVPVKQETY